jgi:hypothetical protein
MEVLNMARKAASKRTRKPPKAKRRGSREKVGSSNASAKNFGGKTDFGVAQKPRLAEFSRRKSREAMFRPAGSHLSDPRQEIGAIQAARVSGVGKSQAGPGGASVGDLDPDIIGVGDGRGISQGGPDDNVAPSEWAQDTSRAPKTSKPKKNSTDEITLQASPC